MSSTVDRPREDDRPAEAAPLPVPAEEQAVTVIERQPGWRLVNLREMWRYRELLFFLTWRDIKVRYKQTVLGAAWAVLQPLATMAAFTVFLGRVPELSGGEWPYPLFVFSGMLPWTFFAGAVGSAGSSVVGSQNLITKVYFPRLIIPASAVGVALVDFAVAFGMLAVLMVYFGVCPGATVVLVPLLILLLALSALGVGTMLAALTVAYRDFRYVVQFMIQLWMFATPTIYMQNAKALGPRVYALLPLNPAEGLIRTFRQAMLGGALDWDALLISGTVGLCLLAAGCLYFRRVERSFADII
jgi:lipopolysaccharide transport system permease protein